MNSISAYSKMYLKCKIIPNVEYIVSFLHILLYGNVHIFLNETAIKTNLKYLTFQIRALSSKLFILKHHT